MRGKNKGNVIMIADDDLFIRKLIRAAIQGMADIVEVLDGADVQKVYKESMPDILFMDIHLPNISGMELIHPLLRFDHSAFIVMISSDSSEDNVRNARLRGSKGFLTKPFNKARIEYYFNNCPTIQFADY